MGMSMSLQFFRSLNDPDLSVKLKAAYACKEAGVELPPELLEFLGPVFRDHGELPSEMAAAVDSMLSLGPEWNARKAYEWKDDMMEGYEINLDDLPKGTKRVRFYCSW